MKDTYLHKGLRSKLIAGLRKKGIEDERILKAMEGLPRHFFLDNAFAEKAYLDKALPIGKEQTISQPYTVAFMTEALRVEKRQRVLEIGTGSGYQAAILSMLGARVFTIERQAALYRRTSELLKKLGFPQIRCYLRDGYKGLPEMAPFDRIIVTAGAPKVPSALLEQLKIGGLMIIPVGKKSQQMYRITRTAEEEWEKEKLGRFRFVPFVEGINPDEDI
ncbi:MAG TPA: protein-L-isoaspartate(D-aspartate) O-methyltransferase [Saprospiraceae bacterium]|nr:protein-L-isoaspartate(D-aspartate) O-methyltransferase [Saprospiraceae bacterium]